MGTQRSAEWLILTAKANGYKGFAAGFSESTPSTTPSRLTRAVFKQELTD